MKVSIVNRSQKDETQIPIADMGEVPQTGDYLDFSQCPLLPPSKDGYVIRARMFVFNASGNAPEVILYVVKA